MVTTSLALIFSHNFKQFTNLSLGINLWYEMKNFVDCVRKFQKITSKTFHRNNTIIIN